MNPCRTTPSRVLRDGEQGLKLTRQPPLPISDIIQLPRYFHANKQSCANTNGEICGGDGAANWCQERIIAAPRAQFHSRVVGSFDASGLLRK